MHKAAKTMAEIKKTVYPHCVYTTEPESCPLSGYEKL